jgi:toxin ParE1/3/4
LSGRASRSLIVTRFSTTSKPTESGRPGRIKETRELVIAGTPYIAAYVIRGDIIRILRILHSARLWPEDLPEE